MLRRNKVKNADKNHVEHDDRIASEIEAEANERYKRVLRERASAPLSDPDEEAFVAALAPLLDAAPILTRAAGHTTLDTLMGIVTLYTIVGPQSSFRRLAVDGAEIHLSGEAKERIDALWVQGRRTRALTDMDAERRERLRALAAATNKE